MQNKKLEVAGAEHWPVIDVVHLEADPNSPTLPNDRTPDEEKCIQSTWNRVAVFEVVPATIPFHIGFMREDGANHILKELITTEHGKFGMRLAPYAATVFVIANDMETELSLALITITTADDPKYDELPLY